MQLIEGIRHRCEELQKEWWLASLARLVYDSLRSKKGIQAERVFARRIDGAIKEKLIQFSVKHPPGEPEEPIALRLVRFEGFEDRGTAVLLVVKKRWIHDTLTNGDSNNRLDFLYGNLKGALQTIDDLRAKGDHVLTNAEIKEIRQKQKLKR